MASYAMCHMKLDMMLHEMDYVPTRKPPRLSVYLTNSLEEGEKATYDLPFANFLSKEANAANDVKRDKPIMCIIGNPPYSVSSSNKGEFIESLLAEYKNNLNERNIQPLSDDYVKFIRLSQYMIDKNGEGVLAFITNNSFLDGRIHREMRKSLKSTFDSISIVDLHGSTKKLEVSPSGENDQNVFDIMQGVSIVIATKVKSKGIKDIEKCTLFHQDLWGSRKAKYKQLYSTSMASKNFLPIQSIRPYHYFVPKDFKHKERYEVGFTLPSLFPENACGMVTARDKLLVKFRKSEADDVLSDFRNLTVDELRLSLIHISEPTRPY